MAKLDSKYHDNSFRSVDTINTIYQLMRHALERVNYSFLTNGQPPNARAKQGAKQRIAQLDEQDIWPIVGFMGQAYCICRSILAGQAERGRFAERVQQAERTLIETYVPGNKTVFFSWRENAPDNVLQEAEPISIEKLAGQILQTLATADRSPAADEMLTNLGAQAQSFRLRNAHSFKIKESDGYLPRESQARQDSEAKRSRASAEMSEAEAENLFVFLRFLFFLLTCDNSRIFIQLLAIYYVMLQEQHAAAADEDGAAKVSSLAHDSIEQTCRAICRIDKIEEVFLPSVERLFEMVFYQSLSNLNAPKVDPASDTKFQEFYRIFVSCGQQQQHQQLLQNSFTAQLKQPAPQQQLSPQPEQPFAKPSSSSRSLESAYGRDGFLFF
ncbi:MAG: hypothetical protein E6Q06_02080 [Candidatus Moraniibacteriota bacterium]|nr:MAG: hypothetical protein E6Q06_02080 [Candidatus Moranbacteria bacterium]